MFNRDNYPFAVRIQWSGRCDAAATQAQWAKPLVHLVDDDDDDRAGTEALVQSHGYRLRCWPSTASFLAELDDVEAGCVLADLCRPEFDGLAALRRLTELPCALPTIILTRRNDARCATAAMKAGALDFLEKPADAAALRSAIEIGGQYLARWRQQVVAVHEARGLIDALTPRESDVLTRLIAGSSNKAIAHDLAISARTVEIHRAKLMAKLNARSLAELIRVAFTAGFPDT
ncbi:LuxR C-terminal-related transcriptional regulator [Sphingomonas sp. KR1UV-12]|uniref:LuxR C-terminal-related transcriptional regulator n=1 Tax=Sphingomonas aurea TaxID=3063994 RepID=A0ABT9EKD4_9SPHN|nr:LuxR C-terminal-related transcriptional regulator [Sphingomonas sp. KR1UV-12]MDP1027256.1 LuxR C-terminal-related transcriptional regulator [Sphingomonas sp. KR1UV-12]